MQSQQIKTLLALLLLLAALAVAGFRILSQRPQVEERPHVAIGEILAEQALNLTKGGGRILLIAPDTTMFRHPGPEVQLEAFHQALKKGGASVSATNLIKLDPLRLIRVPSGDFAEIIRKSGENDVIVSLLGPPVLTAEHRARLTAKHGRVVAVCSGDTPRQLNLKSLFEDGFLHVAVISRTHPPTGLPQSKDPRDWFNHYYEVITPANAGEMSVPLETAAR